MLDGPFYIVSESTGATWITFNQQSFKFGPYEISFDARHRILYRGNAAGGLWALAVP